MLKHVNQLMEFVYDNFRYNVENPSSCPHCHNGIEPRSIYEHSENSINYSAWKCTFRECGKMFIASHEIIGQG